MTTRALLLATLAAVLLAHAAHAQQCMCPAPTEPPAIVAGLPPVVPGGGYVFLPVIGWEVRK